MQHVSPQALPGEFKRAFPGRRFVVVSNREPYEHTYSEDGEIVVRRPAGGLTSALDPILQAIEGDWVAWGSGAADRETSDAQGRLRVPPEQPSYTLHRVWLDQRDVDGYYLGYANQLLWPLCHMRPALTRVRAKHFERYTSVNQHFADAVVRAAGEQPAAVWFQDYHLALAPALVREKRSDLTCAHFWHIPFPPPDIFRIATRAKLLIDGLLANDLVGFHLPSFTRNFLRCAEEIAGASVDWQQHSVRTNDRTCYVRSFPISIDIEEFERAARAPDAEQRAVRLRARFAPNGERIGVGVDRVDYSKGLEEKFKALDLMWSRYPELRETFTFVQVAVPSRTEIDAYDRLNDKIERMAWSLNERYGTDRWTPVHLIKESWPAGRLAILYRIADLCVVSSLQDGMNLVAKEFVASQVGEPGVLLLSTFAGAAEELSGCMGMNPYDPEQAADLMRAALEMPKAERARKIAMLRGSLRSIYDWLYEIFHIWGAVAAHQTVPLASADLWA